MSELEFDFVVIGAGIVGAWTAKELTKHGKVVLIEQFLEPHTRGSSQGQSRLIRSGYAEPFFADMMPHAYKMWREAEAETKEKLIETTGLLCIADSPSNEELQQWIGNMKRLFPEHLVELTGSDIKSKYPSTLRYDDNLGFMFDKSGGVIFSHKALQMIELWFEKSGGILWDNSKVTKVVPNQDVVKIVTTKGDVTAKTLVVCAGPWTKQLLNDLAPSLPFQPEMVKVYYWKEKEPGAYSASKGFPCLLDFSLPSVLSFPSLEYPGLVKALIHGGVPFDNPDERDKVPVSEELESYMKSYIKEHYPLLESEPSIIETCMYTNTPDGIFVIDNLPGHKNILIGTGFSGTGFKTAPVVGRLLCELARGVQPFLDVTPYRTGFKTSPVVGRLLGELARGVQPFLDLTPYRYSRSSSS